MLEYRKFLPEFFLKRFETVSEPFLNQNQYQYQNQNQELIMSGKPDDSQLKNSFFENQKPKANGVNLVDLKSQAMEVLNFLNEKTGRVYRPSAINMNFIIARLKSGASVMDCREVIAKKIVSGRIIGGGDKGLFRDCRQILSWMVNLNFSIISNTS